MGKHFILKLKYLQLVHLVDHNNFLMVFYMTKQQNWYFSSNPMLKVLHIYFTTFA